MKLYLDDVPLMVNVTYLNLLNCDANQCRWDSFSGYLKSRRFNSTQWNNQTLREFCFSHLNNDNPNDNQSVPVPWWLAFAISIPLAVITIALIKIALIMREKKL